MNEKSISTTQPDGDRAWVARLAQYEKPRRWKAIGQLANTLLPYLGIWAGMIVLIRAGVSTWAIGVLTLPAAALLIRVFILFHDCCHGSLFASHRANRVIGLMTGVLTFTPYEAWRRSHAGHHTTAGDLDRRGTGDVWTLTVREYARASRATRLAYRVYRHPLFMFGFGPIVSFMIMPRIPSRQSLRQRRVLQNTLWTDLWIAGFAVAVSLAFGVRTYLMIQLPVLWLAAAGGIWLFYVQHQFPGVRWVRHGQWDRIRSALEGSSYYHLPRPLRWVTGDIGLHHIHHLRARIPNYRLQECYNDTPQAQRIAPLTLRRSLACLRLRLWNEDTQRLVGFRDLPANGP